MKHFIIDLDNVILNQGGIFPTTKLLRPYSIDLINFLSTQGTVHLYSSSIVVTELFILRYNLKTVCEYNPASLSLLEYLNEKKINSYNSIIIHDSDCITCRSDYKNIQVLSVFMVDTDDEIGILKDYLTYKLHESVTLHEIDFSDWDLRLEELRLSKGCRFKNDCIKKEG